MQIRNQSLFGINELKNLCDDPKIADLLNWVPNDRHYKKWKWFAKDPRFLQNDVLMVRVKHNQMKYDKPKLWPIRPNKIYVYYYDYNHRQVPTYVSYKNKWDAKWVNSVNFDKEFSRTKLRYQTGRELIANYRLDGRPLRTPSIIYRGIRYRLLSNPRVINSLLNSTRDSSSTLRKTFMFTLMPYRQKTIKEW